TRPMGRAPALGEARRWLRGLDRRRAALLAGGPGRGQLRGPQGGGPAVSRQEPALPAGGRPVAPPAPPGPPPAPRAPPLAPGGAPDGAGAARRGVTDTQRGRRREAVGSSPVAGEDEGGPPRDRALLTLRRAASRGERRRLLPQAPGPKLLFGNAALRQGVAQL